MEKNELLEKEIERLAQQVKTSSLPPELSDSVFRNIEQLRLSNRIGDFLNNFHKVKSYIDWIINLPWKKETKDILDLKHAQEVLDQHHYGLQEAKNRVLEYLSVLILQEQRKENRVIRAPILCFVGLVGTGKTTIASSIAEAMGRQFIRIPFGGLGDPLYLRGQSRVHDEAEPGQIIKGIRLAGANNPVILLDEIDRVADEALNAIMGVLVELLDPEQNSRFTDYYIDYPFDLSSALFIATANNTRRIATAVLDRLEPIQMPSYNDDEKYIIGKKYLLPRAIEDTGLTNEEIKIDEDCWASIVRPLGYDAGVRTLKRTIEGICRKVARLIVEGRAKNIRISVSNVKDFLPQW